MEISMCRKMRTYLITALVYTLVIGVRAGYFTSECVDDWYNDRFVRREDYNVTDGSVTVYSHVDDMVFPYNPNSYRSCINIWTNRTDHVIKLEEVEYNLRGGEDSCIYNYLDIYFTSLDKADTFISDGKWCGDRGPGTLYSSDRHMFLYFFTIYIHREKGFEFVISSIHKDDVPPQQLSAGAILGIVFGVLVLMLLIILIVTCVLMRKKKSRSRHTTFSGAPVTNNQTVTLVTTTNTMYNQETVGGNDPPPQYDQLPPAYQTSCGMPLIGQPVGPPPPAKDVEYQPPTTRGNPSSSQEHLNGPPPSYPQDS